MTSVSGTTRSTSKRLPKPGAWVACDAGVRAAIVGAFEVGELTCVEDLRRLLQIAVVDTLGLENSIARSRTLGYLTQVGAALLEKGEMEARLQELEATLSPRLVKDDSQKRRRWR